ncbi:MAG TPA: hypothetical protein VIQ03_12700, partial [Gammaproteobacteria bacterium]
SRQAIDTSISPSNHISDHAISVEIDINDNIHVVYSNTIYSVESFLYYQVYNGVTWSRSTVVYHPWDVNNGGFSNIELLLDISDGAHACYTFNQNYQDKYYCAENINNAWYATEVVLDKGVMDSCANKPFIKASENGNVFGARFCNLNSNTHNYIQFISYINGNWSSIGYAPYLLYYSASLIEPMDNTPYVFTLSSILGTGDTQTAQLVEYHPENSNIVYNIVARRDTYDTGLGSNPYLTFDNSGYLHASYDYPPANFQCYSNNAQDSWQATVLRSDVNLISDLPFTIAPDNSLHFFYQSQPFENKHIVIDESGVNITNSFMPETVLSDRPPASFVDSNGDTHLAYLDTNSWEIKYATNASGDWVISPVYGVNYTELEKSVFSDQANYGELLYEIDLRISGPVLNIAFVEWHVDNLWNYTSDLVMISGIQNQWSSHIVTSSAINEYWGMPSLAIDNNNHIHIAYPVIYCSDFCYPTGIVYGSDKSGIWQQKNISVESFFYGAWFTGYEPDLSINNQGDVQIAYVYGSDDTSAVNQEPITSEIRAVKIDECMPVSHIIRENVSIGINTHTQSPYIGSAINIQGLGAVAFYDKLLAEPHILIEKLGLNVESCATANNVFRIEINNASSSPVQLANVAIDSYVDGVYTLLQSNCDAVTLTTGSSCYVDVQVLLPILSSDFDVDFLFNVDSTLYLNIQQDNASQQFSNVIGDSVYVIDTSSLRPAPVDNNQSMNGESNVATGGSGGSVDIYTVLFVFIYFLLMHLHDRRESKIFTDNNCA